MIYLRLTGSLGCGPDVISIAGQGDSEAEASDSQGEVGSKQLAGSTANHGTKGMNIFVSGSFVRVHLSICLCCLRDDRSKLS